MNLNLRVNGEKVVVEAIDDEPWRTDMSGKVVALCACYGEK